MKTLRAWLRRMRGLFLKSTRERDLADEIESHLQLHIEDNLRRGMAPAAARRDALLRFGPLEAIKESYRDQYGLPVLEFLWMDLRVAGRMLAKRKGYALVAVVTLSLGLGANVTVASLANATLFRPPPHVRNPGELVSVHPTYEGNPMSMSYPVYIDHRAAADVFDGLGAYGRTSVHLRGRSISRRVSAALVTGDFFALLGVPAAAGRLLMPADDVTPDTQPVAVISNRLWRREFGGDTDITGETVFINDRAFTVVGVAPRGFHGIEVAGDIDVWAPMMMQRTLLPGRDLLTRRGTSWLRVVGRLQPGVDVARAAERLSALAAELEPGGASGAPVVLFDHVWVAPYARDYLVQVNGLLGAVVALILVLAAANVTNLQLTQATLRSREIAVRRAIGAGRGRLLRQFAAEGVILGVAGGLGGIGLAWGGTKVLGRYHLNANMPLADAALRLDPPVIGLACSLSLVVGIACALLPALRGSGRNLAGLLHGSLTSGSSGARLRAALVTLQIAISFVVLVAAGLLVRTLLNLQAIDPGFDAEAVATVSVDLELDGFDATAGPQVVAEALGRIRQAPGTIAVAAGDSSPFTALSLTRGLGFTFARLDDSELPAGHADAELGATLLGLANVTPDYFRTLGVPVLAGRPFRDTDDAASPPVVIVSSVAAESLWPGQSPVGRHLLLGREGEQLVEVVGVAGDLKRDLTRDAASWIYKPLAQSYSPTLTFFVRGAEPGVAVREMQGALLEVEPLLTLFAAGVLADYVDESLWETRLFASFVGLFGVVALLIAAAGLYGVLAHTVAQRSREMGVRIALGASVSDVASWVGRKSAVMVATGTVVGGVAALWATRFLESRFHGVEPADPLTFASTFVLLGVVAVLACVVPVSRATNVDPVVVLRDE